MMRTISAMETFQLLNEKQGYLIDVRELGEHYICSIEHATLKPLSSLNLNDFAIYKGDKKIIIHCQAGKRSALAAMKVEQAYPDLEVYSMEGGLNEWVRLELPVIFGNDTEQ